MPTLPSLADAERMIRDAASSDHLPLHDYYLVEMTRPEDLTAGGIALADGAKAVPTEGTVIYRGPGRVGNDGRRTEMQAGPGDRVVAPWHRFLPWKENLAFVADPHLAAVVTEEILPANDYVLIRPHSDKTVDAETRSTVVVRESGLLVAAANTVNRLGGDESRRRKRGEELYRELGQIGKSERYLSQPSEYYRDKVVHDFLDGLCQWELAVLGEAIQANGDLKWKDHLPWTKPQHPKSGTIVRFSMKPDLKEPRFFFGLDDWIVDVMDAGDRVHFEKQYQCVTVYDGYEWLLLVKSRYLAAVESE